jgi:aminopeptidase N
MSTYLVAFGFGDLQSKHTQTKSGVKIGVYGTKAHAAKELDFALDIAKRSIEFFEEFYETPYPLPQSNQLALPDFSAGAMENWGLVTYREAYLLLDPDNTALQMKQVVATVIAHELAHQWFGDLVTMQWWDDLWLNESFANMMQYVAIDAIEPDWHVWELFQTSDAPAALRRDATDGVQSVHVAVNHPAEIDSLFDSAIVYAKGARSLVMVRALIGDDALRAGLKSYFAKHQYGNTVGADLWNELAEASGFDIKTIMDTWLEQPGYPVVEAKVVNGDLILTQEQFFIGEHKDANRSWQIPLNANYATAPAIFADKELNLGDYKSLRAEASVPFRANVGNDSHFIVKYDATLLADILAHADELDNIAQLQLIQDLRFLAEGSQVSYADIVPLLVKFADSTSFVVNSILYAVADGLKKFTTADSEEEKALKAFYGKISANNYARLGWSAKADDTNDDVVVREYVVSAALYAENPDAIKAAHDLFLANKDNLVGLSADIRAFVLRNEVKHFGTDEVFEQLLAENTKATDPSYKQELSMAITSVTDEKLITRVVGFLKDAEVVKPQDLRGWVARLLRNEKAEQAAWDWVRDSWGWLEEKLGGDMEFSSYITVISGVFKTPERLAEFKAFYEPKIDQPGLTREITMDIEVIASRVALVESQKTEVNAAIAKA